MRYVLLLLFTFTAHVHADDPLRIAVAANFRATLQQITDLFQRQSGYPVVLSSGSTGVLYNQILHGAPFDLLFAADRASPEQLAKEPALAAAEPFCYAIGQLVLAGGSGELTQLANSSLSLAIANPVTAPYGMAAMAVLAKPEFAAGKSRKLVRGTNVVQAYQFWHSGAVDLALVPRALQPAGTAIPGSWHQPLEQYAIALTPATDKPALTRYLEWVRSDTVRTLISDAGYQPCP
jgi:molybdate transport system substrate-binding protein